MIIFICSCNKVHEEERNLTIKYYAGFGGYNHPVKLIEELNENQIKDRDAYCIRTFINGKLTKVEKILNNKIKFTYNYSYDKDGNFLEFKISKNSDSSN